MTTDSMTSKNKHILETFYSAFQRRDGETMADCYHPQAQFEDAVFKLEGARVGAMWKMLCQNGKDLVIEFSELTANETSGSAHWTARYTFSRTGRKVTNRVVATFEFKDGKILRHKDQFSFWKWASQALGPMGILLGWSQAVKGQVQSVAAKNLEQFVMKQSLRE
jgi:ketosteroid isomerase-like protein